jgi:DNA-binding NtrC family response regulator
MKPPIKSIFIFDDDEDILSICSYILEEKGWIVYTSEDCNDIIQKITEVKPAVILMDNWIPDEGGVVATQKLKASDELKQIPVIYFSANSDIKIIADLAGADNYLAKPFDLTDLESVINLALEVKSAI